MYELSASTKSARLFCIWRSFWITDWKKNNYCALIDSQNTAKRKKNHFWLFFWEYIVEYMSASQVNRQYEKHIKMRFMENIWREQICIWPFAAVIIRKSNNCRSSMKAQAWEGRMRTCNVNTDFTVCIKIFIPLCCQTWQQFSLLLFDGFHIIYTEPHKLSVLLGEEWKKWQAQPCHAT